MLRERFGEPESSQETFPGASSASPEPPGPAQELKLGSGLGSQAMARPDEEPGKSWGLSAACHRTEEALQLPYP